MAHFARVKNEIVTKVHVVNNAVILDGDFEREELGQVFLANLHGGNPEEYIQCSYNGNFRGIYPGAGFRYDANLDVFIDPEHPDETVA